MGLPFDESNATFQCVTVSDEDHAASPSKSPMQNEEYIIPHEICKCDVHKLKELLNLRIKQGGISTSFNGNESTKSEVPEKSIVDSNILEDREEEEKVLCSKIHEEKWGSEELFDKEQKIQMDRDTSESQPDGETKYEEIDLPSEAEEDKEAEKLPKENKIEQTDGGEVELSSQVEQTHYKETVPPTLVDKDKYIELGESTKNLFDGQSYKVKNATNDSSSNGGKGTCPADQRKESDQVGVTLPPMQNGSDVNKGDDDDDDDDGKKPRQMQLKRRHECEELEKKKEKKKKKQQNDKQESRETIAEGDLDKSKMHPTAAEDQTRGGGDQKVPAVKEPTLYLKEMEQSPSASLPVGDTSVGELQTGLVKLSLNDGDKSRRVEHIGPGGDNKREYMLGIQEYMLDGVHSCPQKGKRMPPTEHNKEAVRRHYYNNESQTGISLPPGQPPPPRQEKLLRGSPAPTFNPPTSLSPQDVIRDLLEGDLHEGLEDCLSKGAAAAGPDPESPMKGTDALRVRYGKKRDVEDLVSRIASPNWTHEDQDGVLLCKEMTIKNGKYSDGGQYNKFRFLGQGTYGDVYLIRDKVSQMNLVSKRVPLEKFSSNEALIWSSLEHSNIVRLLGLVMSKDMVYLFSEYHTGQTLWMLIQKEKVLGQGRALFIIRQLFEALAWLHGKRIVHKDVKPKNILIDDDDRARLIDFGESKRLDGESMLTVVPEGTVFFMAPEIARSDLYNGTADVWSACCTLICAISGAPPWCQRLNQFKVKIYIIGSSQDPPLQDVPPNTDPRVLRFLEMGLVIDFSRRPTSAQVLENFPDHLVNELYNRQALDEDPDPDPVPEGPFGIPEAICNQPVVPCTPRGPQADVFRATHQSDSPDDSLDITQFYDVDNAEQNPQGINMSSPSRLRQAEDEEEEDLYGPGLDMYGPDVNMDDQDEIDGLLVENAIREGAGLATNHTGPLLGVRELPVNSQAASNFIQDQPMDQHDDSLELPEDIQRGSDLSSVGHCFSRTVFDSTETSVKSLNPNGASNDFGARGYKTSGFRSSISGVSSDIFPSSYNSMKTSVVVFTKTLDPIKMKCTDGFTVREVATATYKKKVATPFTLVQRNSKFNNGQPEKMLQYGEFEFDVEAAPDSCEKWLWRVDDSGHISRR